MALDRETLRTNFEKHGFAVSFFDTAEDARAHLCAEIHDTTVGIGGCATAVQMGLAEALSTNNAVYTHAITNTRETRMAETNAEAFICSANGVSLTGELVNIDGMGNRVAATLFGPERVFFVIGANKVEPTLEQALWRARNVASPKNAQRLGRKTPCAAKGDRCYDCNSPERICNGFVTIARAMTGARTELVFVDEELGF
jgi:hypothetical protein